MNYSNDVLFIGIIIFALISFGILLGCKLSNFKWTRNSKSKKINVPIIYKNKIYKVVEISDLNNIILFKNIYYDKYNLINNSDDNEKI